VFDPAPIATRGELEGWLRYRTALIGITVKMPSRTKIVAAMYKSE
jgi:hypothetical protein